MQGWGAGCDGGRVGDPRGMSSGEGGGGGEGAGVRGQGSDTRPDEPVLTPDPWPLTPDDVLDLLTQLVEKSLVVYEERGAETRYRLLETMREYARERLLEAGEE